MIVTRSISVRTPEHFSQERYGEIILILSQDCQTITKAYQFVYFVIFYSVSFMKVTCIASFLDSHYYIFFDLTIPVNH